MKQLTIFTLVLTLNQLSMPAKAATCDIVDPTTKAQIGSLSIEMGYDQDYDSVTIKTIVGENANEKTYRLIKTKFTVAGGLEIKFFDVNHEANALQTYKISLGSVRRVYGCGEPRYLVRGNGEFKSIPDTYLEESSATHLANCQGVIHDPQF